MRALVFTKDFRNAIATVRAAVCMQTPACTAPSRIALKNKFQIEAAYKRPARCPAINNLHGEQTHEQQR
jgi:hypothetical protein